MLEYGFMQNAFAAAGIVAVVGGLVGYFLVLRGQTFAGHALGHVGFAGATGAVLIGVPPFAGLIALSVLAGLGMGLLGERITERDVAIGIVLALALGFGLLFLSFYTAFASEAAALLFGNVLAVDARTVFALLIISLASLGGLAVISRPLAFASLAPEVAEARGVSLRLTSVLFLGIVGLATAGCAEIVGVLLVFTLMVGPGATAQRLTGRLGWGLLLAAVLAVAEAWLGIALAFYTDWPSSFWITALSTLAYLAAVLVPAHRPAIAERGV
ncbi:MAG: metal ABC transporter permease [Acetobacteraceae bacterium]